MELRLIKYFLTVAHAGNITKAAETLHITQPTLSRQLVQLEESLGATLFIRGKRQITLTNEGVLFQQRAKEIVLLIDKAERELTERTDAIGGVVSIGCVETLASRMLPDVLEQFSALYPKVQYNLYSANGDDIREKLDKGFLDIGLLLEPVETAKYDFIKLPFVEQWGVLMREDDPLASRDGLRIEEIVDHPLILPQRAIVQNEIASWFGAAYGKLHVFATHNLLTNAALLAERGLGYVICVGGAFSIRQTNNIRFVPFEPERTAGHELVWRKNNVLNSATSLLIQFIRNAYQA